MEGPGVRVSLRKRGGRERGSRALWMVRAFWSIVGVGTGHLDHISRVLGRFDSEYLMPNIENSIL